MLPENDAKVLTTLREHGPGTITVRQLAENAGLPRVTVRTAVAVLSFDGLVCLITDSSASTYVICHLHAGPGECEEPLGRAIQEVHPDGQR